ncbi:MAG: KamA family radical SAM protein [Bacteroidales bacterium]
MKSLNKMMLSQRPDEDAETEPPGKAVLTRPRVRKAVTLPRIKNNLPVSDRSLAFMARHFPDASIQAWNDWHWQLKHSFTTFDQLSSVLELTEEELLCTREKRKLPLRITPYFAGVLETGDPTSALRRTMVPDIRELHKAPEEQSDPLGEENQSPLPQLVHRYPDRVLFLTTGFCSAYCRYCTRSHLVSKKDKVHASIIQWDEAIEYIRLHPEVRDVLLSGGDPLTLSDARLEYLLMKLRAIPHVEIIRIGTKVPVVMPQRVTSALVRMMKKYHPLYMSIHFTHPDELTPETAFACNILADAGIPLGSQTVLLKGINDEVEIFRKLMQGLLKIRVKPYYIYQCDPIPGSSHFRTSVSKGLDIIRGLRGFTSGYAVPHFVVDAPGGGGKIPLLPEYVAGRDDKGYLLVNYLGKVYLYPEPASGEHST